MRRLGRLGVSKSFFEFRRSADAWRNRIATEVSQYGKDTDILTVAGELAGVEMASGHRVEILRLRFAGGGDIHCGGGEETAGSVGVGRALRVWVRRAVEGLGRTGGCASERVAHCGRISLKVGVGSLPANYMVDRR